MDYKKMPRANIYGQVLCWLMAVEDHSTEFTAHFLLPRKNCMFVAFKLEWYFGLVGYPLIFHTVNVNDFTTCLNIDMIVDINLDILTVTGHPSAPRDQGECASIY